MIEGLIAGRLYSQPRQRSDREGKPVVLAKVRAADGNGEAQFINAVAFSESAQAALLALRDGDAVALSGALVPRPRGDARAELDMVVAQVLTLARTNKEISTACGAGLRDECFPAGMERTSR